MPTVKFTSFEQAADALLLQPESTPLPARLRKLYALSARLGATPARPGVRKYRSYEEAGKDRLR